VKDGTDLRSGVIGKFATATAGLMWGGRWTLEKDGYGPDYDHIEMAS
jgi:hypothetical protein